MLLSNPRRFALLASVTVAFLAAASAPTPLYPRYQAEWALSSLDVTVIFGVYALAVLASLLVFGRLSDHLGRRPVLLASLGVQLLAMAGFAFAGGFAAMLAARIVQGLATGAAVAAVGAGLLDIDKARGTVANSVVVPIGTATGGLVAGLVVSVLPAPGQLIYGLLALVFVAQIAGVVGHGRNARTVGRLPRRRARLVASAALGLRGHACAAPACRAASSSRPGRCRGFFGSLGPALLHGVLGLSAPLASGLLMFTLAGSAGLSVVLSHRFGPAQLTTLGAFSLGIGLTLITLGLSQQSIALFFVGAAIAGARLRQRLPGRAAQRARARGADRARRRAVGRVRHRVPRDGRARDDRRLAGRARRQPARDGARVRRADPHPRRAGAGRRGGAARPAAFQPRLNLTPTQSRRFP